MIRSRRWLCLCSILFVSHTCAGYAESPAAGTSAKRPIPLIFDTDIGNDIDDALALSMIHALMSRGECRLLAVTVTKDEPMSAPFVDVVNTFYGRGNIPIGVVNSGPTPEPSKFTLLADQKDGEQFRYPHRLTCACDAPEAVELLRKTLVSAKDRSVVMVQVGAFTNLARLIASKKDDASDLSGMELVQKKVRLLSIMAGWFDKDNSKQPEFNVKIDLAAAEALVSRWPTPIVFSGFEIGTALPYPAASIEKDFAYAPHHPVAEAYKLYDHMPYDRPTWDLTSVLYAVRPERGYFELSPPGRARVTKEGGISFEADSAGQHRYLILRPSQKLRVEEALVQLASQPPAVAGRLTKD